MVYLEGGVWMGGLRGFYVMGGGGDGGGEGRGHAWFGLGGGMLNTPWTKKSSDQDSSFKTLIQHTLQPPHQTQPSLLVPRRATREDDGRDAAPGIGPPVRVHGAEPVRGGGAAARFPVRQDAVGPLHRAAVAGVDAGVERFEVRGQRAWGGGADEAGDEGGGEGG